VVAPPVIKREVSETVSFPKVNPKIKLFSKPSSMAPPKNTLKRPAPPERRQSSASMESQPPAKKQLLKFKINVDKVEEIQRSPPKPSPPKPSGPQRKQSPTARNSPAPARPSPSSSIRAPSPSVTLSASPAPQPPSQALDGIIVAKTRKPLPDPTSVPSPAAKERKPLPDAGTPPPAQKKSNIIKLKIGGFNKKAA